MLRILPPLVLRIQLCSAPLSSYGMTIVLPDSTPGIEIFAPSTAIAQSFFNFPKCGVVAKNKMTANTAVVKIQYSKITWPIFLIFLKVIINSINKKISDYRFGSLMYIYLLHLPVALLPSLYLLFCEGNLFVRHLNYNI